MLSTHIAQNRPVGASVDSACDRILRARNHRSTVGRLCVRSNFTCARPRPPTLCACFFLYVCMYVSIRHVCCLSTYRNVFTNFYASLDHVYYATALRLSLSVMDSERTVRECRSSESGEAREQRLARDRARQRERRASEDCGNS